MSYINQLFQGEKYNGEIDNIIGKTIDRFYYLEIWDNCTFTPLVYWLKLFEENHWNRFFLDAGLVFWEIHQHLNKDDFNYKNIDYYDLAEVYELKSLKILSISVFPVVVNDIEQGVKLEIKLSDGRRFILEFAGEICIDDESGNYSIK